MISLYGIQQCDTVKKARQWLEQHQLNYEFIDFKKTPPTQKHIKAWLQLWPWEQLINRRGTTWRKLPENTQNSLNQQKAIALMQEQPSIIKRPILISTEHHLLGFQSQEYQQLIQ